MVLQGILNLLKNNLLHNLCKFNNQNLVSLIEILELVDLEQWKVKLLLKQVLKANKNHLHYNQRECNLKRNRVAVRDLKNRLFLVAITFLNIIELWLFKFIKFKYGQL